MQDIVHMSNTIIIPLPLLSFTFLSLYSFLFPCASLFLLLTYLPTYLPLFSTLYLYFYSLLLTLSRFEVSLFPLSLFIPFIPLLSPRSPLSSPTLLYLCFTLLYHTILPFTLLYFMSLTYTVRLTYLVPPQEAYTIEDSLLTITILACE